MVHTWDINPALGMLRQENSCEFWACLGYTARPCLKIIKKKNFPPYPCCSQTLRGASRSNRHLTLSASCQLLSRDLTFWSLAWMLPGCHRYPCCSSSQGHWLLDYGPKLFSDFACMQWAWATVDATVGAAFTLLFSPSSSLSSSSNPPLSPSSSHKLVAASFFHPSV